MKSFIVQSMPHLVSTSPPIKKVLNDKFVRVCAQSFFYLILTAAAAALKWISSTVESFEIFSISVFVCLNIIHRAPPGPLLNSGTGDSIVNILYFSEEEEEEDDSFEKVSTARSSIQKEDSNTSGIHQQFTVYSV